MNTIHSILFFLEGKKVIIGSIIFYVLAFLLGRHLIADDVMALIMGVCGSLGISIAAASASPTYRAALGAYREAKIIPPQS